MKYRKLGSSELEVSEISLGFRNERQANCNLAAANRSLSTADIEFIRKTFAE